jgi:ATP-dependent Clp protease ATP-binding subunit ClpB
MDVVRAHFRPEFLNRLDDIMLFHRLKRSDMAAIVDIQLARLQKLLDERKVALDLDESARAWLAEKGYDPVYGARPLRRVIERRVQNPLAQALLRGEFRPGDVLRLRAGKGKEDGAIALERESPESRARAAS